MSTKKQPWEPLDGLSKPELEELKLRTEIQKLRSEMEEKQKGWAYRNVGILIPSVIGLLTLLTGYFTGFFNVEAKRLEIKKDLLVREVADFTAKKDTLNKENIALSESNKLLLNTQEALKKDRQQIQQKADELNKQVVEINRKMQAIEKEKKKLGADVASLDTQKKQLEKQKESLQDDIARLNDQLSKSAFYTLLRAYLSSANYSINGYSLRDTVNKSPAVYRKQYIRELVQICDTTRSYEIKGGLQYILYSLTGDDNWKKKCVETGEHIVGLLETDANEQYSYYQYWSVYSNLTAYINYYNENGEFKYINPDNEAVLSVVKRLIGFLRRIPPAHKESSYVISILSSFTYSYATGNAVAKAYLREPDTYCFLVSRLQQIPLTDKQGRTIFSYFYNLENVAPLAVICYYADLLSNNQLGGYFSDLYIGEMQGKVVEMIGRHATKFTPPPMVSSPERWAQWKQQNQAIINAYHQLKSNCNPADVSLLTAE